MPHSDITLFNQVAKLYDDQLLKDSVLQEQINDCNEYHDRTEQMISDADSTIRTKDRQITDADSIVKLQQLQMANLTKAIKLNRKIAIRETIGWTVGGFAVGVSVPLIVYFIKH